MQNMIHQKLFIEGAVILLLLVVSPSCCSVENNDIFRSKVNVSQTEPYWIQLFPEHAPSPRTRGHIAYDTDRERIVLFGGVIVSPYAGSRELFDDTWEFDGTDWIPVRTDVNPQARYWGEMCYCPAWGCSILFGGVATGVRYNDTWRYEDGQWTQLNPPHKPTERWDFAMAFDENLEKILLFGGCESGDYLGDFWSFDGTDWQFVLDDPQVIGCGGGAKMVYDSFRKKTVLYGGYYGMSLHNATWEYDGQQWTKIDTPTKISPLRENFRMSYDKFQRKTILFGGGYWVGSQYYNDTWEYDGLDWTKVQPDLSPFPRSYGHFVYMDDFFQSVYFGGSYNDSAILTLDETWVYSAAIHYTPAVKTTVLITMVLLFSFLIVMGSRFDLWRKRENP